MSPNFPSSDTASLAAQPLSQGYWVRLTGQMDRLQASLDEVLATTEAGSSQVEALLRHLTDPARSQAFDERLAGLLAGQEAGQEQWEALSSGLNDLAQTVAKLSRTQFKSNTLAEMKDQHVATALGVLQDVAARREQAPEARTSRRTGTHGRAARRGARRVCRRSAAGLRWSGDGVAKWSRPARTPSPTAGRSGAQRPGAERDPRASGRAVQLVAAVGVGAVGAWPAAGSAPVQVAGHCRLSGMRWPTRWWPGCRDWSSSVRGFLGLLATADIYPIEAAGRLFDPRLHLALETASRADLPDGAVVNVLRKGYRQRERVLRYAEVTVNRVAGAEAEAPTGSTASSASEMPGEDGQQQDMISESHQP